MSGWTGIRSTSPPPPKLRAPHLEFVERRWTARAPSGRVLECSIFRSVAGFEARVGYGENLLKSQYGRTIEEAREHADAFRQDTINTGRFAMIGTTVSGSNAL